MYSWRAILKDGTEINQFQDGIENTFKSVMDVKENLLAFQLVSEAGVIYSVHMETGEFNLKGFIIKSSIDLKEVANKEPIYWKRSKVVFSSEEGGKAPEVYGYIIGWQANIDGKNYQHQFMIDPYGEVTLLHKV